MVLGADIWMQDGHKYWLGEYIGISWTNISIIPTPRHMGRGSMFSTSRLEKLLTSFDARAGLRFWGFKPPILAVAPGTLPLSYALKPTENIKS